jgi:hypothetical protein
MHIPDWLFIVFIVLWIPGGILVMALPSGPSTILAVILALPLVVGFILNVIAGIREQRLAARGRHRSL